MGGKAFLPRGETRTNTQPQAPFPFQVSKWQVRRQSGMSVWKLLVSGDGRHARVHSGSMSKRVSLHFRIISTAKVGLREGGRLESYCQQAEGN